MSDKYENLHVLTDYEPEKGCPVVVKAGGLIKDNEKKRIVTLAVFENVSKKIITSMEISIVVYNDFGSSLGNPIEYTYRNVNCRPGTMFGKTEYMVVPDPSSRKISIKITSINFSDGSIWPDRLTPPYLIADIEEIIKKDYEKRQEKPVKKKERKIVGLKGKMLPILIIILSVVAAIIVSVTAVFKLYPDFVSNLFNSEENAQESEDRESDGFAYEVESDKPEINENSSESKLGNSSIDITPIIEGDAENGEEMVTKNAEDSQEPEYCYETDYVKISGIFLDDSYKDEDNNNIRLLYVFYDAFSNNENLEVSSKLSKLTINDVNTYSSSTIPGACKLMGNYYYSDYVEHIYVGDTKKIASTFNVPLADVEPGKDMSILLNGIPDSDKIKVRSDDIKRCSSPEEIATIIDPDGYADFQKKYELADEDTTNKVRKAIDGYQWEFFVNSFSYELEFIPGDRFQLRVPRYNIVTDGKYVVRNGFISVTNDVNGHTTDIPWSWGTNDIDLDVLSAYDVME